MVTEVVGIVTKVGKVKDYGFESNYGRTWTRNTRFFIQIQIDEKNIVNAMVDCNAEETDYGFKIPEKEERQKPFVGDKIKITTHCLKKGNDGTSWASVTWNQVLEVMEKNQQARADLESFKQKKKQEREDIFRQKLEGTKQKKLQAKADRLNELEKQRQDTRLPEVVRKEISQTFDLNTITSLLRDTTWFKPIIEGEGGKTAIYSISGAIEQEGYPGTGMRRPNGALYNKSQVIRTSILNKAIKSGLITVQDEKYSSTELGQKLLLELDSCENCKEQKKPYHTVSHYTMPDSWSSSRDIGITFHCKCEIENIYRAQSNCNSGVTYTPAFKKINCNDCDFFNKDTGEE